MTAPAGATFQVGLPEHLRAAAARLYLDAFAQKLGPVIGRGDRAEAFLVSVMRPQNAVCAFDEAGALIGLAGFHDETGGFIGGEAADFRRSFGALGALWRTPLMILFERSPRPGEMLLDGVAVAAALRGRGVGAALLRAVACHARATGFAAVRLEVVEENHRALALYRRLGFAEERRRFTPWMRPLFGFGASRTMILSVCSVHENHPGAGIS